MAFLSKMGSILRQTASNHMKSEISASTPSIFQAIRCMSSSKLFIGGLSYSTDEQSLKEAFGNYGEVVESRVIMDRETGRSRGFGFITYTSSEEASSAIQALDGQDLHGRRVRVNYATDRARTGGFGDGGYGGGGGGYGGGGYGGGGGNYGGGGGGYGGGGGNYGGGGGYNDGGYRGGGGGGDSFSGGGGGGGGDSFSAGGGGNFSSGGGDAYGSGSGNLGGGSGTFGVPGVAGGGDQFGSNTSNGMGDVGPLEGSFRDDDDEPDDFAKRA